MLRVRGCWGPHAIVDDGGPREVPMLPMIGYGLMLMGKCSADSNSNLE